MTRIIVHVGAPKTGTTAIQGFLAQNEQRLRDHGVNYTQTERPHIAHNVLPRLLRKGGGRAYLEALQKEIDMSEAQVHVISSEMLFRPPVALQLSNEINAHLPRRLVSGVRVVCYLRRHDQFIEALYKQLVKNGKIAPDPAEFLARQMETLSFMAVIKAYGREFGPENVIARPFERSAFRDGDVIRDFVNVLGVPKVNDIEFAPTDKSNRTLSGEISEILGQLRLNTQLNTRQMIRDIINQDTPAAFAKNDVYDRQTRENVVAHFKSEDAELCTWSGKTDGSFFDLSDLEGARPSEETQTDITERWREASSIVAKAIGKQINVA